MMYILKVFVDEKVSITYLENLEKKLNSKSKYRIANTENTSLRKYNPLKISSYVYYEIDTNNIEKTKKLIKENVSYSWELKKVSNKMGDVSIDVAKYIDLLNNFKGHSKFSEIFSLATIKSSELEKYFHEKYKLYDVEINTFTKSNYDFLIDKKVYDEIKNKDLLKIENDTKKVNINISQNHDILKINVEYLDINYVLISSNEFLFKQNFFKIQAYILEKDNHFIYLDTNKVTSMFKIDKEKIINFDNYNYYEYDNISYIVENSDILDEGVLINNKIYLFNKYIQVSDIYFANQNIFSKYDLKKCDIDE